SLAGPARPPLFPQTRQQCHLRAVTINQQQIHTVFAASALSSIEPNGYIQGILDETSFRYAACARPAQECFRATAQILSSRRELAPLQRACTRRSVRHHQSP